MRRNPPPDRVLTAFAADATPQPIDGGRGTAWRAGDLVLKPLDMSDVALRWQAEVLTPLSGRSDLRIAAPVRASHGRLSVDGWTAWPRLEGACVVGSWDRILRAGTLFSTLTSTIPRPSFLDTTIGPWAEADRIAWGERSPGPVRGARFVPELLGLRRPLLARAQLMHGDLTGNVLFAEGKAPAVIDISPYWRPPAYATGIVLVDVLTWEHASVEWAAAHLGDTTSRQAFVRALLFRVVTDRLARPEEPIADAYEPAVGLARRLLG